jgi:hypothetical protein
MPSSDAKGRPLPKSERPVKTIADVILAAYRSRARST